MRRSVLLLTTILLSVATAAALTIAAMTTAPSGVGHALPVSGEDFAKEAVRSFYDAINEAIATGNLAPVETILAPEFVDHASAVGPSDGRQGFLDRLADRRAVFPHLRLVVVALSVNGDIVVAQIRSEEGARGQIGGVSITAPGGGWSLVDRLRLAGNRIAERWPTPEQTTVVEPLAASVVAFDAPRSRRFGIERLELDPGEAIHRPNDSDPRLLLVVAGTLTVRLDESALESVLIEPAGGGDGAIRRLIAPGQDGTVTVGEQFLVAGDRWHPFAIANDTPQPAQALSMSLDALRPTDQWTNVPDAAPWPMVSYLAGGRPEPMPAGRATVRIARAVLAPGALLLPDEQSGPMVVAVQNGLLLVTADPTNVEFTDPTGIRPHHVGAASVGPGSGIQLSPGTAALTSVGPEPAEVLIATVTFAVTG